MQSADIDLSEVIATASRYLGIEEKELARRFDVDRPSARRPKRKAETRNCFQPPKRCKENSNSKQINIETTSHLSEMTRTGRLLSKGSRSCFRRWMRMQSADIDLSAVIAAACRHFSIEEKELARRFNIGRSAISQAAQRVSRDPELFSATKTIQRELEFEINQQ